MSSLPAWYPDPSESKAAPMPLLLVQAFLNTRDLEAETDVLSADYIRTARSKGLPERSVLWGHAFRNISITLVTIIGLQFGYPINFD